MFLLLLPTFASFLLSIEKSTSQGGELQMLKVYVDFSPGLILPGSRPVLICMAILYKPESQRQQASLNSETDSHPSRSPAQCPHCTGRAGHETPCAAVMAPQGCPVVTLTGEPLHHPYGPHVKHLWDSILGLGHVIMVALFPTTVEPQMI